MHIHIHEYREKKDTITHKKKVSQLTGLRSTLAIPEKLEKSKSFGLLGKSISLSLSLSLSLSRTGERFSEGKCFSFLDRVSFSQIRHFLRFAE